MNAYRYKKVYIVLAILTLCMIGSFANAASLRFDTGAQEIGLGQAIEVFVYLDTDSEVINAVEGDITLSSAFALGDINAANSLVPLWAEQPEYGPEGISFSGIIPGGWRGRSGFLFSFVVYGQDPAESAIINAQNVLVLLHDGEGTELPTQIYSTEISIDPSLPVIDLIEHTPDTESPEIFQPLIARDMNLFGGDYFLVFQAQDKGSGVKQYEVRESKRRLWNTKGGTWDLTESPYRIEDQTLKSFIYVRAVDNEGNVRIARVVPDRVSRTRRIVIIGIILLVIALLRRKRSLRKKYDQIS